jgi:hypothetical protein
MFALALKFGGESIRAAFLGYQKLTLRRTAASFKSRKYHFVFVAFVRIEKHCTFPDSPLHHEAHFTSDRKMAAHVGCSAMWVSEVRRSRASINNLIDTKKRTVTRKGKTYEIDTSKIGERKSNPPPVADVPAVTKPPVTIGWQMASTAQGRRGSMICRISSAT